MRVDNDTISFDDLLCTAPDALSGKGAAGNSALAPDFLLGGGQDARSGFDQARDFIDRGVEWAERRVTDQAGRLNPMAADAQQTLVDPSAPWWLKAAAFPTALEGQSANIVLGYASMFATGLVDMAEFGTKVLFGSGLGADDVVFASDPGEKEQPGTAREGVGSHVAAHPGLALGQGLAIGVAGKALVDVGVAGVGWFAGKSADAGSMLMRWVAPPFDPRAEALLRSGQRSVYNGPLRPAEASPEAALGSSAAARSSTPGPGPDANEWALYKYGPKLNPSGQVETVLQGDRLTLAPAVKPETALLGRLESGGRGADAQAIESAKQAAREAGKKQIDAFTASGRDHAGVYARTGAKVTDSYVNPNAREVLESWMDEHPDVALPRAVFDAYASKDPLTKLNNLTLQQKLSAPDDVFRFGLQWDLKQPSLGERVGAAIQAPRKAITFVNESLNFLPPKAAAAPWKSQGALLLDRVAPTFETPVRSRFIQELAVESPGAVAAWDAAAKVAASTQAAVKPWVDGAIRLKGYGVGGAAAVAGYYGATGQFDVYENSHEATAAFNVSQGSRSLSFVFPHGLSAHAWWSPMGIRGSRNGADLPFPLSDDDGLLPTYKTGPLPREPKGGNYLSAFLSGCANLSRVGLGLQIGNHDEGYRAQVGLLLAHEAVNLRLDVPVNGRLPKPSIASSFTALRPYFSEAYCHQSMCLVYKNIEITPQTKLGLEKLPAAGANRLFLGGLASTGGKTVASAGWIAQGNPSWHVPYPGTQAPNEGKPTPFDLSAAGPADVFPPALTDTSDSLPSALPRTLASQGDRRPLLPASQGANPLAGRVYRAVRGDSISTVLGTSHPQAIGSFMLANGLTTSTIYAGRNYFIPDGVSASAEAMRLGQSALDADNLRLARVRRGP